MHMHLHKNVGVNTKQLAQSY